MDKSEPVVITGAAGLVGQNLIALLKFQGFSNLVAIDKHSANSKTLTDLHPDVRLIQADLAEPGSWEYAFQGAGAIVLNHAQITALEERLFIRNNVIATSNVLTAARRQNIPYIVHISSSVVNSLAHDFYTESKKAQEKLVVESGIPSCVLRPTLMFGWFDRKHLGWLARFMRLTPIFPIPGPGRYLRQPLYVKDFCEVIAACLVEPKPGTTFNISGQERIDFIDLIHWVVEAVHARTHVVRIPYSLFAFLLAVYAMFDRNPPFTTKQLQALVTPDVFEVIDWPSIFSVRATPLREALRETFQHPTYSKVVLEL
jgi:nucleoside-diphosphate-sugar epimerase